MLHIIFNESDVRLMQEVMLLDETLQGPIQQIKDDFAVGPLCSLETEGGWLARIDWWKQLLTGSPYGESLAGSFDDRKTVVEIGNWLNENEAGECWIWMGQNQHDVSGYYWLIAQLRPWQGRVQVVYLNNLPFLNEKGQLFYPSWLQEIPGKEFLKAKKLARPVTISEFEIDPDEWRKLTEENAPVRTLEGGKKLQGKDSSFYDADLMRQATGDWQKASRLLLNTLHRMKVKTGDVFLMGRIRELIACGQLEVNGDPTKGWKDFDIRLAGTAPSTIHQAEEANQ